MPEKKRANVFYFSHTLYPLPCLSLRYTFFLRAIHDFRLKALCSSPACLLDLSLSSSAFLAKCYYYSVMTDRFAMYTRLVIRCSSNSYIVVLVIDLYCRLSLIWSTLPLFFFFLLFNNERSFAFVTQNNHHYILYTYNRKAMSFLLTLVCMLDVIVLKERVRVRDLSKNINNLQIKLRSF